MKTAIIRATAVDLFCGAGGLTRGLLDAGISVVAGYDMDGTCRYAYEHNNEPSKFYEKSILDIRGRDLAPHYPPEDVRILVGCAPCQPFSRYAQGRRGADDAKWTLLNEFARLICESKPDIVSMENVPELAYHAVFDKFLDVLQSEGFHFVDDEKRRVIYCPDYGLAQQRSRLVIMASRFGPIQLPPPTHVGHHRTVRDTLAKLPPLEAGQIDKRDPLHRCSRLSDRNLRRIRNSIPGGTWRDWPQDLVANCHKKETGKYYSAVYGRMTLDDPSPTITTQFYGFGNGRFGHPTQDRALSLREGAILQSFPRKYEFAPPDAEYSFATIGRMIGNAVPVRLGRLVGCAIRQHLLRYQH